MTFFLKCLNVYGSRISECNSGCTRRVEGLRPQHSFVIPADRLCRNWFLSLRATTGSEAIWKASGSRASGCPTGVAPGGSREGNPEFVFFRSVGVSEPRCLFPFVIPAKAGIQFFYKNSRQWNQKR